MLKTNSKQYQTNFKNYILSVIDSEDLPSETMSDKEKINYIFDRYTSEYENEYNKRRIPNNQARFADWLSGLSLNIPYTYYYIVKLSKKLLETDTLKNENKIIDNYFSFMAMQMIRLKINLNK